MQLMSYEVEVKYRSVDHDHLARALHELGAVPGASLDQEDLYLNHPSRDFAATGEALRIRRLGNENRITYKGTKHAGPTKTRREIEISFDTGDKPFSQLLELLELLSFRPVATIRKRRESFHLAYHDHELEIALDTTEGLGVFAEIEALAASQADLPAAQAAVLALAESLGLTEVEPRSYLRMALEAQSEIPGGDADARRNA
jgi:adenylate cyclase class 2